MARHYRRFDFSLLQGKRIALVGPADSAYNTGKGDYIDGFDYVVRVNRAPYLVDAGKHVGDIGTKTDILYHSFYENNESGGGALDLAMYRKQGLKYLINPRNNLAGLHTSLVFYKKYGLAQKVYTLPRWLSQSIDNSIYPFRPTIGFMALMSLIQSDCAELYITGFTFYKTDFGAGYRDHIRTKDQATDFIKRVGIHNIEQEFQGFFKTLKSVDRNNIELDPVLENIIENELTLKK
jgi:hypothetical protein